VFKPIAEQTIPGLNSPELSGHRADYSLPLSRHRFWPQLLQKSQTRLTTALQLSFLSIEKRLVAITG